MNDPIATGTQKPRLEENFMNEDLAESHIICMAADTVVSIKKKPSFIKTFFYNLHNVIHTFFNGYTLEAANELIRVEKAIKKVKVRQNYLQKKGFFENKKELFKMLSIYEMLVNYKCELYDHNDTGNLGLSGSGDSRLVDEVLSQKW